MVGCIREGWLLGVVLLCFIVVVDVSLSCKIAEKRSGMYSYFFAINIGVTSHFLDCFLYFL